MSQKRSEAGPILAVMVGVVACAACCAGPLLALLSAIGVTSVIASIWLPAMAVVAVASGAGIVWLRRRRTNACALPGLTDLPTPVLAPRN